MKIKLRTKKKYLSALGSGTTINDVICVSGSAGSRLFEVICSNNRLVYDWEYFDGYTLSTEQENSEYIRGE